MKHKELDLLWKAFGEPRDYTVESGILRSASWGDHEDGLWQIEYECSLDNGCRPEIRMTTWRFGPRPGNIIIGHGGSGDDGVQVAIAAFGALLEELQADINGMIGCIKGDLVRKEYEE